MNDFNKFVSLFKNHDSNFNQKEPTPKSVFDFLVTNGYIHKRESHQHEIELPIAESHGEVVNCWEVFKIFVGDKNIQFRYCGFAD